MVSFLPVPVSHFSSKTDGMPGRIAAAVHTMNEILIALLALHKLNTSCCRCRWCWCCFDKQNKHSLSSLIHIEKDRLRHCVCTVFVRIYLQKFFFGKPVVLVFEMPGVSFFFRLKEIILNCSIVLLYCWACHFSCFTWLFCSFYLCFVSNENKHWAFAWRWTMDMDMDMDVFLFFL